MIENIPREKILEVVKEGPTLPAKIAKRVGGDTMIIGAILSTLINTGDVDVSTLKIGGSPLYYVPGQEEKLEAFIDHLNEKDQKTFNLLKEKKLLQDSAQDPLTRVSLKIIKDFAKPVDIDHEGKKEMFWRFYSYDRQEAMKEAIAMLDSQKPAEIVIERQQPVVQKTVEIIVEKQPQKLVVPEQKIEQKLEQKIQPEIIETPKHKPKALPTERKRRQHKDFLAAVTEFVNNKGLDIISKEKIKKTEYTFVLKNHDTNEYIYCVAKDKKNVSDGDLSTAYVFAHAKNMPCLFLMTGALTKKAEEITAHFKGMDIEEI